jgi:hypothetical protein
VTVVGDVEGVSTAFNFFLPPPPEDGFCPICMLGRSHPILLDLYWDSAVAYHDADRKQALWLGTLERHGVVCDLALLKTHMVRHEATLDPPLLDRKEAAERAEATGGWMKPRAWTVLDFVMRQRVATTAQLAELVYGVQADAACTRSKQVAVSQLLSQLNYRRVLSRIFLSSPLSLAGRTRTSWVWVIGPVGRSLYKSRYGQQVDNPKLKVTRGRKGVRENVLLHDLSMQETFWQLHRLAPAEPVELASYACDAQVSPDHWYGSDWLGWQFGVQGHWYRAGKRRDEQLANKWTDGLAALDITMRGDGPADGRRFLIPFAVEYDRGTRDQEQAVDQLLQYSWVHEAGCVPARFPQLDRDGYELPLVEICEGDEGDGTAAHSELALAGWPRVFRLVRSVQAQRARLVKLNPGHAWERQPPVFLTTAREIRERGLGARCLSLWAPLPAEIFTPRFDHEGWRQLRLAYIAQVGRPLAQTLVLASKALTGADGRLDPAQPLQVVLTAAAPNRRGVSDTRTTAGIAEQRAAQAEEQLMADAATQAREAFKASEIRRRDALGSR